MVIVVLATLAGLLSTVIQDRQIDASAVGTATTLTAIRDAIAGASRIAPGATSYAADMRSYPRHIADLLRPPPAATPYDPNTRVGWRGPYLRAPTVPYQPSPVHGFSVAYGTPGHPVIDDHWRHDQDGIGWQSAIVLQYPDADDDGGEPTEAERLHVRIVSAGPDGILDTPGTSQGGTVDAFYPPLPLCGDDLVVYLRVADLRPAN